MSLDRRQNTAIWQNANTFNLIHNLPEEYISIKERRDFYKWYIIQIKQKGQDVIWPSMAYYLSRKLRLTNAFPTNLLAKKVVKVYANKGSEMVFNKAFVVLKLLYNSDTILTEKQVIEWDKTIVYKEQYVWLAGIYKSISTKSLKQIERIAKGKFLYGIVVPKKISFTGDITNAQNRYNFALEKLRVYCKLNN